MSIQFVKSLILVVLTFVAIAAAGYFYHETKNHRLNSTTVSPHALDFGKEYKIKSMRVLEGHLFDVVLEDGKHYLTRLSDVLKTMPEAKDLVVRKMNLVREQSFDPILIPVGWDSSNIFYLSQVLIDQDRSSLSDWLRKQNLVYN